MKHSKNIYIEIELLRKKLIETGFTLGLTAPQTIALSQALDKLMNTQNAS